jgi:hypothetical protein
MRWFEPNSTARISLLGIAILCALSAMPSRPEPEKHERDFVVGEVTRVLSPVAVSLPGGAARKTQDILIKEKDGKVWQVAICLENCGSRPRITTGALKIGAAVSVTGKRTQTGAIRAAEILRLSH